ncbi:MAG: hypothetical protein WBA57_15020 [Elainellaceae cyanobacterium]
MNMRMVVARGVAIATLLSSLSIFACRPTPSEPPLAEAPTPVEPFPDAPEADAEASRTPLPDDIQIYQDDSGLFALALPQGYSFESMDNGMTFRSKDEGFGGAIAYQMSDTDTPLDTEALESRLREEIESKFSDVTWQSDRQPQSDGSFRIDWQGKTSDGQTLDALSFIEQHGNVIYTFNAYGVDQPYNEYNRDAQIIVGTYVVQENPPASINTEAPE